MVGYIPSSSPSVTYGIHGGVIVQDPNVIQYTESGQPIILSDVFGSQPLHKSINAAPRPPLRNTQSNNLQVSSPAPAAWTKPRGKMTPRPRTATDPAISNAGSKHEAAPTTTTFGVAHSSAASGVTAHGPPPIFTTQPLPQHPHQHHPEHAARPTSARASFAAVDTCKTGQHDTARGAYADELSFHTASYPSAPLTAVSTVKSSYDTNRSSESNSSASPSFEYGVVNQAQPAPAPLALPPSAYPYPYSYPPSFDGYYNYAMPVPGRRMMEPILAPGELPAPRPTLSYAALIGEALLLAPAPHQLYVSEIADSVKSRYVYYRQNPSKIYNGVRHQTSMCKAFVKLPRPYNEQSGGARKWAIRAGCETWFHSGGYYPPGSPSATPAGSHPGSNDNRGGKARSTARSKQLAIGVSTAGKGQSGTQPRSSGSESPGPSNGPAWDGSNRHLLPLSTSFQSHATATPSSAAPFTPAEVPGQPSHSQAPGLPQPSLQSYNYIPMFPPTQNSSYPPPGYQYIPLHHPVPAPGQTQGQHAPVPPAYHQAQQGPYYVPIWGHYPAAAPSGTAQSVHVKAEPNGSPYRAGSSTHSADGEQDAYGSPVSGHETG